MNHKSTHFRDVNRTLFGLARLPGRNRKTIRRYIDLSNIAPTGTDNGAELYLVSLVAAAVFEPMPGDDGAMTPRERFDHWRAMREQRRHEIECGQLIPIADFDREFSRLIKLTAAALETLPDRLQLDAGLSGPQLDPVIRAIDSLRETLYTALTNRGSTRLNL